MTHRTQERDRGTSLVELMVVVLILSIVMIVTVGLTISMQRTTATVMSRQDQIDAGRTAVERMSKVLRTAVKPGKLSSACTGSGCSADAFILAQDFALQFYANLNNEGNAVGPSRVSYTVATSGVNAGILIEKVQIPDPGSASVGYTYCDAESTSATTACKARLTTQRLAGTVSTTSGQPLFSYFDGQGVGLSTGSGGLGTAEIGQLLSVEMRITVLSTSASKPLPTTFIQRVLLPNSQAVLRPW